MRHKEQLLWQAMRNGIDPRRVRLERIESVVTVGTPDVHALGAGVVTWCELKAVRDLPRRAATRVFGAGGLSVAQRNWHLDWCNHGGRSIIIGGIGAGQLRQHVSVCGMHADKFNDMCWVELMRHACIIGVGAAFWPRLETFLRTS